MLVTGVVRSVFGVYGEPSITVHWMDLLEISSLEKVRETQQSIVELREERIDPIDTGLEGE